MKDVTLTHHGILGQKWGKRNGPPYPLDAQDHSASEKKAGWKKSLDKSSNDDSSEKKKGLSDKQKQTAKRIAIGAAVVAGTCLAAYGGYRMYKSGNLDPIIDKFKKMGENGVGDILNGAGGIDSNNTLNKMFQKELTDNDIRSAFKGINPNKTKANTDIQFLLKTNDGHNLQDVNCQACTLAYEVRRRTGKDVIAQLVDTRQYSNEQLMKTIYENPKILKESVSQWSELDNKILSMGNGARGNLVMQTKRGSHSIAFEVANGKTVLFDCQNERAFGIDSRIFDLVYGASKEDLQITRTDNLSFNADNILDKGKRSIGISSLIVGE